MSTDVQRLRQRLIDTFEWRTGPDRWSASYADDSGWFRDPEIVAGLGEALASLDPVATAATVVIGPESRGTAIALLVAAHLGVGIAEVRREPNRLTDDDQWLTQLTPPDYQDRHLELAVRRTGLHPGDRVLFVDDWIDTGAQATACHQLVEKAGAQWLGAHVIVDSLTDNSVRRRLGVRRLLHNRDL